MNRRTQTSLTLLGTPLLVLALAACGGATSHGSSASVGTNDVAIGAPAPSGALVPHVAGSGSDTGSKALAGQGYADRAAATYEQPDIISTGTVSLESKDVGQLRFDVGQVVDQHDGQITDENTQTDSHGAVLRSRLVIRVPAAEFGQAMTELAKTGQLIDSTRKSTDVTTQVIDVRARVKSQAASVHRIRLLLGHANSISEIMSIESELTQRTADLDSLRQQQAYLTNQTSFSTITVSLQRTPAVAPPKPIHKTTHHTGFLAGLKQGWHGLTAFGTGLATFVGLVLPVAILLALLGLPIAWAVRRYRPFSQSRTARTPSAS